jgi:hypothetical protein
VLPLEGKAVSKVGTDKSVIRGLYGPRASAPRSEIVGSSGYECSPLGAGSGTVSCGPVTSNDPCWSSLRRNGGGGGSKLTVAGLEAFATGGALDLPLCEKINDTVRIFLTLKTKHTLEKFL